MTDTVIATDGVKLPLQALEHVYTRNESNLIISDTVVYRGRNYTQFITYDGGSPDIVSQSQWILQS